MNNVSAESLDESDRQKKQAEMIRQYLQVTNIDSSSVPIKHAPSDSESSISSTKSKDNLLEINLNSI